MEGDSSNISSCDNTLAIVMICHNDAKHLKRSIGAILDQLQDSVRFVFVDDSSDDNSYDVAKNLVGNCGEVIQTPRNMNIGGARNFGYLHLKRSENPPKYVWFHDSDDYITEGAVDRILTALSGNRGVDLLSIPIGELRISQSGERKILKSCVSVESVEDVACAPVSAVCKIIKFEKFVPFEPNHFCEHVAWHYMLMDGVDTWAKIEGDDPLYIWDRTNDKAISETVEFCYNHPMTLESLVLDNTLARRGLNDRWVSDCLRNLANMLDVRHAIKKQSVRRIWLARFRMEYSNFMCGRYVH